MAKAKVEKPEPNKVCGIIMPISSIDGCNAEHWADVLGIISTAAKDAGYEPNLVSNSEDIGVIQKRIVQNLYDNDIVVCDVSGKNANVMFELGLRLAFDKPTIVIKDDKTGYSFDTSPIEHLEYPRDLRFQTIVDFKSKLARKIEATVASANGDPEYSTFLKHFGTFKVAELKSETVTEDQFIMSELMDIKHQLRSMSLDRISNRRSPTASNLARKMTETRGQPAFQAILKQAIIEYCLERKIDIERAFQHTEEISRALQKDLDAPRYCRSPEEFDELVNSTIFDLL